MTDKKSKELAEKIKRGEPNDVRKAAAKANDAAKAAAKAPMVEVKPAAKPAAEAKEELPTPSQFTVTVLNDGKELYTRTVEWANRLTCMKGTRQKIRDWGATIREAKVEDAPDGGKKTIKFTGLTISEKPRTVARTQSDARKNAEAKVANETDSEIIGIAYDPDAKPDEIKAALNGYDRHKLIHAYNTIHTDAPLPHYTKKVDAIKTLANVRF